MGDARTFCAGPRSWSGAGGEREGVRDRGAEGCRLIVVLDTAGVEALAPMDENRRARLRVLRRRASDIVVPAAVLAEGVLTGHPGHDFHVRRLLDLVDVAGVDQELGHAADALRRGALRAGLDTAPSGVDAIVAAAADAYAAREDVEIVTSDEDDIVLLATLADHADRLSVVAV